MTTSYLLSIKYHSLSLLVSYRSALSEIMSPYIFGIFTCLLIFSKDVSSVPLEIPNDIIPCSNCRLSKLDDNIQFHLHTRQNPSKPYILQLNDEVNLAKSPFNYLVKTIIFIHGFSESAPSISCQTISDAYLARGEYNVIRVDWGKLASAPSYITAARNVKVVGPYVAKMVKWLVEKKAISMSELHVIGFSLGAHVAGFMAKKLAPRKVGRITGLDPAGPMFEHGPESDRLCQFDATFTDIIHTNTKAMGIEVPIGHVDFYPNGGESQPGCEFPDYACSHRRSWAYYAESVINRGGFTASKCTPRMPAVDCNENPSAFMGFAAEPHIQGIYFLQTNSEPPFARNLTDYTWI